MGTKAPQPPPEDKLPIPPSVLRPPPRKRTPLPAFAIAPACNHDPIRGPIELVLVPVYSDNPPSGPAYLRCRHCGDLMGTIGVVGSTQGTS